MSYTSDITALIDNKRYASAIALCKDRCINYASIQDQVRNQVQLAINAFENRDFQLSIDIFITTIGVVEPSTVLCRFFAPHLTRYLMQYLVELHKMGYANEQHTKLLFNMFYNDDGRVILKQFIEDLRTAKNEILKQNENEGSGEMIINNITQLFNRKDNKKELLKEYKKFYDNFNLNADAAVDTLINNDMEEYAFEISNIMEVSKYIISLLINSQKDYFKAAAIIYEKATQGTGKSLLMDFGPVLLNQGDEIASMISKSAHALWVEAQSNDEDKDFLKIFWGFPENAKEFLKMAIADRPTHLFINTFFELLLPRKNNNPPFFGKESKPNPDYALERISDINFKFDIEPIIYICKEAGFTEGIIKLLEREERYSDLIFFLMSKQKTNEIIEFINSNIKFDDEIWVSIFEYFINLNDPTYSQNVELIKKLLDNALKTRTLFELIEKMCDTQSNTSNNYLQFEIVQNHLNSTFHDMIEQLILEEDENNNLVRELDELESEITRLEESNIQIRPIYCDQCGKSLVPPYIAFFCGHSYHPECCLEIENGTKICPICNKSNEQNNMDNSNEGYTQNISIDKNDLLDSTVDLIQNGYFSK